MKSSHQIYLKKYRSEKKTQEKPVGKTLQILNIPPYATESAIRRIFSEVGEVERVSLIENYKNEHKSLYKIPSVFFKDPLPSKFLIGFVVFKKSSSLDAVWKIEALPALSTEEYPILTGIEKWTSELNERIIDTDAMQQEINLYIQHYDKVKAAEEEKANGEDDDGWITVGKKGGFQQNETVIGKLEKKYDSQKKKNIKNFYSFEFRESKKQQLMELRKKFEEDKVKLNLLKQNRKFKPY